MTKWTKKDYKKGIFSIWVFFRQDLRFTGQLGREEAILTPLYHLHQFHRYLDISPVITAESSSLHLVAPDLNWEPLLFKRESLITKLKDIKNYPKKKRDGMVVNNIKIYLKMKNKAWLSTGKNTKWRKPLQNN